jgi:hypothetical protein
MVWALIKVIVAVIVFAISAVAFGRALKDLFKDK